MASREVPNGPWTNPTRLLDAGPEFELAFKSSKVGAGKWVEWATGTKTSRILIARQPRHGESILRAIELQREEHENEAGGGLDNASIERSWQRAISDYKSASSALVPCLAATTAGQPMPATTYCVTRGVFFHAFCPESLTPLRTCRDDALLASWGLERFGNSLVRYAVGVGASLRRPAAVYTWSRGGGTGAVKGLTVRRRNELYRDYATLWQRDLSAEQRLGLQRDFPCWQCAHREQCYGAASADGRIVAEDRLLPLNFHDAHAVLLESMDVSFEGLAALLSGASAGPVLAEQLPAPPQADRRKHLAWHLDGARPWLTSGTAGKAPGPEVAERLAREVACVKLRMFEQVCHALAAFQAATGRAYENLSSGALMARFVTPLGATVPARWSSEVRLLGHGAPVNAPDAKASGRAGLGMLLAHLLLRNDARDGDAVEALVADLVHRFERSIGTVPGPGVDWARNLVAQTKEIAAASVLHEQRFRQCIEAPPIAADLWLDLWTLTLRLLTSIDQFSFADWDQPGCMDDVCRQVTALAQRLDVEAFGVEARRSEIAAVLGEQIESMRQSDAGTEAR